MKQKKRLSLGDIAAKSFWGKNATWELCARAVVREHEKRKGEA